jgi:ABC-type multidrug transport system ATPase subunit
MAEPVVVVEHLAKRFGRKAALDDVSFTLDAGEIVGLIGPNGAGKSTAFSILCGLLRPDAGSMRFRGAPLGRDRGRYVSLIPETPDVYPLLTVWEHLVFVARLCRLDAGWETRGDALLGRFEMLGARDTLGSELSKGMRQKTLVAATILAGTPVLLLDEPMIGLDPLGQRGLRDVLRDLRAAGTAVMLSTHQLETAEALCDRVIILNHGRAVASGTIDEMRALGSGSGTLEDVFLEITRS